MLFNNIGECTFESQTFTVKDEVFSLMEVGKVQFDHTSIHIPSQGKDTCLIIYLRRGHIIFQHAKNDRVILQNELVLVPLANGATLTYADADADFLLCANFPSAELTRNHLRVPAEIDPTEFDDFLASLMHIDTTESLAKLLKKLPSLSGRDAKQREFIRNALVFMNKNVNKRIMLEDIAATIDYSKFHFIRIFDEFLQQTPHQYICDRRLYMARGLLASTDLSIADVAIQSGIHFTSNFYSHFKRKFKTTPKDYRETLI